MMKARLRTCSRTIGSFVEVRLAEAPRERVAVGVAVKELVVEGVGEAVTEGVLVALGVVDGVPVGDAVMEGVGVAESQPVTETSTAPPSRP
jgi:hypothetical protein